MKRLKLIVMISSLVLSSVQASVYDEIVTLEVQKAQRFATRVDTVNSPIINAQPSRQEKTPQLYTLPNGKQIDLNSYTLVLFMQSRCPYCQQFDPLLMQLANQTGFKVFAYTLDGQGDTSFPDAIPAPPSVVEQFFGTSLAVMTPTLYLVNVNTLKTFPISQGVTSAQEVLARINTNLMMVE